jgi:hypothetical protein
MTERKAQKPARHGYGDNGTTANGVIHPFGSAPDEIDRAHDQDHRREEICVSMVKLWGLFPRQP